MRHMTGREIDRAILAVAAGDRDALKRLYTELRQPVFTLAFTISKNRQLAEDVVQDTFVAVCEHASAFRPQGRGRAWILATASHLAKQHLQKESRCCLPAAPDDASVFGADPRDFARMVEQNADAARLLCLLSPKERDVVILHVLIGLKHREIAEELGLPRGSVIWTYNNALKKLKNHVIRQEGGFYDASKTTDPQHS